MLQWTFFIVLQEAEISEQNQQIIQRNIFTQQTMKFLIAKEYFSVQNLGKAGCVHTLHSPRSAC